MKFTYLIALLFTLTTSVFSIAGPGHGHSHDHGHSHGVAKQETVLAKSKQKINQLIEKKKLDASWGIMQHSTMEKKTYKHGTEWIITYENKGIEDKTKQTLYMFYSLNGHYIAANFTGK